MKKNEYVALPKLIKARADTYLKEAKSLSESWYGMDNAQEVHLLSVQLATAMMNMEAAQIVASEIAEFGEQIRKRQDNDLG